MEEDSQITSSPSILIPESPDGSLHSSPDHPPLRLGNQLSETYTQPDDSEENARALVVGNDNVVPEVYNTVWYPGIVFENANSTNENIAIAAQFNDSNQSEPVLPVSHPIVEPWRPNEGLYDDSNQSEPTLPSRVLPYVLVEPLRPNVGLYYENSRQSTVASETHADTSEESNSCDRACKDEEVDEPPSKVRKLETSIQDDGETCPICLDSWGNSGPHRLVALKCGHLFGAQCVERWLRARPAKDRSCPTCKSRASLRDVRCLYARRLVCADNTQITALQRQIETLQQEKNRTELELHKSRIAHRACMLQLEDLRKTLLKTQVREQPVRKTWRFALEKNLEINKDGGCRVLTYNCRTYELYVSQKSTNNLFPGYGIRKVSCVDYKLGQFLHLHPKPIRDITYSQPRDLLLSVGLDNTARIVERGILNSTIQCCLPLWSCTWDYLRSNEFYVGGTGGVIQQYDIRNPATYIEKFNSTDLSPVVSLVSTEHGLLSCQLNSCWLWTSNLRRWDKKSLPVEGPFMSLCYDNESHRVLVSSRAGVERAKLHLCKVKSGHSDITVEYDQVFSGSARTSVMCRSAFVRVPGSMWVASHSESDSSLDLFGLDGCRSMRLPASEPAVAVCAAQVNDTVVAALSEARLRLYRAQPSS